MRRSDPPAPPTATPASPANTRSSAQTAPRASTPSRNSPSSAAEPSLPRGSRLPAVVQAAHYFVRPIGMLASHRRRYGDFFTLNFPFFDKLVYVVDPEAIREIFTGDPSRFHAGEGNAGPL